MAMTREQLTEMMELTVTARAALEQIETLARACAPGEASIEMQIAHEARRGWVSTNVIGMDVGRELRSEVPCSICGKTKGQPPERCPGHYVMASGGCSCGGHHF